MNAPRIRLDIDATREKLCQLACGHAADALDDMIGEAVRDEISAHVFLDRLLTTELAGREERRVRVMQQTDSAAPQAAVHPSWYLPHRDRLCRSLPALRCSERQCRATGAPDLSCKRQYR